MTALEIVAITIGGPAYFGMLYCLGRELVDSFTRVWAERKRMTPL